MGVIRGKGVFSKEQFKVCVSFTSPAWNTSHLYPTQSRPDTPVSKRVRFLSTGSSVWSSTDRQSRYKHRPATVLQSAAGVANSVKSAVVSFSLTVFLG
ncbi:hypothetical protein BaRGS_00009901 [Batillaria attramentaria]|uniref:Uncharacterized protein n=1 Tax=Batillaria attramentaria TaxID=370345 RepID=A0ABD0LGU2_9CAEN